MKNHHWITINQCALVVLLVTTGLARAQNFSFESAGARVGGSDTDNNFHQAEAFLNCNLPWHWDLNENWRFQSRLDLSAGWLGDSGADAFIATAGPSLFVGRANLPLSLEGGSSPTFISRHEFDTKNFGTWFQFTSHIGVNLDVSSHFRIGYRFQHMSNAGISSHNPGLNLHMFAVSYLF